MKASGKLRIVPSCALGSLAPNEGEPIFHTWRWYHSVTGLGLWIVLVLAIVLPKANRRPKALLILVPLAAVVAGWRFFAAIVGGSSGDRAVFDIVIYSLAIGSAVLWLLAHRFAGGSRRRALLAALGVGLTVSLIGGLSLGFESTQMLGGAVFIGVMMVATILGYASAVWAYRGHRAGRFLAFHVVGTLGASLVGMCLTLLVMTLLLDSGPNGFDGFVEAAIAGGFIAGFMVLLIALPFAILGLANPFFRQRLRMCLPHPSTSSGNDQCDSASIVAET